MRTEGHEHMLLPPGRSFQLLCKGLKDTRVLLSQDTRQTRDSHNSHVSVSQCSENSTDEAHSSVPSV